jgi:hypothetical protein
MRKLLFVLPALACAAWLLSWAVAQPPGRGPARDSGGSSLVEKMMAFDKNKDGKLTKDEVTDRRLHRLFDQADANKDGVVTKEELTTLAKKLEADDGEGRGGRGGPGGRGGRGGRGGPGGPGGRDGFGPPRPGQLLPSFVQDQLELTDKQKKELEALQKHVDERLGKILTAEQKKQLEEMRPGPGGRGGPGGPGGDGPGGRGGRRGGPGGRGGDGPGGPPQED